MCNDPEMSPCEYRCVLSAMKDIENTKKFFSFLYFYIKIFNWVHSLNIARSGLYRCVKLFYFYLLFFYVTADRKL